MLPLILATVSLTATVYSASLAAAAECQVTDLTDGGGAPQGMTTWKGITLSIPPLTMTVEREIFGDLAPSPVPEVVPSTKNSRIPRLATNDACGGQSVRKSTFFNQALIRSIVKIPSNGHTQFTKVPVLPYNGKRQVLTIRTTLPEIEISPRYNTPTLIGPVQEVRKNGLSNERTVSQAVATLPSTVESHSLFGSQPFVAVNPFRSALQQLPDNESHHMNLTTTMALHGGNCASGCP